MPDNPFNKPTARRLMIGPIFGKDNPLCFIAIANLKTGAVAAFAIRALPEECKRLQPSIHWFSGMSSHRNALALNRRRGTADCRICGSTLSRKKDKDSLNDEEKILRLGV